MPRPETPSLAADTIIELVDRPGRPILLIKRKYEPLGWAIPGGFVDIGESLERAAEREALEETSLVVRLTRLLGVYSDPQRDARGHTVSAVFIAEAQGEPRAEDDAESCGIFGLDELPSPLAFDHASILSDYRRFRETGELPPPTL